MTYAIAAKKLFDGEAFNFDHSVIVEDGQIVAVLPTAELPANIHRRELCGGTLAPGFIDTQVNGGGGVMLNNAPCVESVAQMVAAHRHTGTTSMMPTLVSDTLEQHKLGVSAVRQAREAGNASVLGVHIEGPFFAPEKRGAHRASMIRRPVDSDISWLASIQDFPVMVTLAPEQTSPGQIRQLAQAGIHVCAGHTNASYQQIAAAVAEGLKGFTHLFNAMGPITAREPGPVGAALYFDATWAGIIADGHHVDPVLIRMAHRAKAPGKLLLVTDAMATVGSEQTYFEIYGERISELDGKLLNAEGVLAGSAIGMIDAVRVTNQQAGIELGECLRMASLYPAGFLNLEQSLGRIATGYRADLVHFDDAFQVQGTWVAGSYQACAAGDQETDSAVTP